MPNAAGGLAKLAAKAWPLLVKNWPKVVVAFGALVKFVNDNPDLPKRLKDTLIGVPQRVADAQRRGTEEARIRSTLDIVRDVAREAAASESAFDGESYVRRADGIDRGVRLAETQDRVHRKQTLIDLRARTDALLAELIDAVADRAPGGASGTEQLEV